jgi:hypothetical protein
MDDELIAAFSRFDAAAKAISYEQVANASEAARRLEDARNEFYGLFMAAARHMGRLDGGQGEGGKA